MTITDNIHLNILIVDDEEVVVSLIRDTLEDDGYTVFTSGDAIEALKVIETRKIDLLITDIRMPRMNGIQLVQFARKKQTGIEVIFITGYANLNSAKEAIKQGASDYILKPFELSEMRQAVYKAVDKIKKDAEVETANHQMSQLTSLHQLLFTAGDKQSITTVSLKFSMMHCNSTKGSAVVWNNDMSEFKMITINDNVTTEKILDNDFLNRVINPDDIKMISEPYIVETPGDCPLFKDIPVDQLKAHICPEWFTDDTAMVFLPITRGDSIFGFMMVGIKDKSSATLETNLKFFVFNVHQLALLLENYDLLEKSQNAYTKLAELQDETIQLEKMATRGEMSAEIGHELNNFIGVVAGSLSLLDFQMKKKNYDNIERHVNTMTNNLEKMKEFTSNLMELKQIATKKEIIYFDRLLNEVVDYLKPQKRYSNVNITITPEINQLPIEADTTHIQQLLYNLMNNAADATKNCESKKINITTVLNDNGTFTLTITDTGVGFDSNSLKKAFNQRFTTKDTGHGFGLLVCRRIVESHNGNLNIDSTEGVGTTISINFPITKEAVKKSQPILS